MHSASGGEQTHKLTTQVEGKGSGNSVKLWDHLRGQTSKRTIFNARCLLGAAWTRGLCSTCWWRGRRKIFHRELESKHPCLQVFCRECATPVTYMLSSLCHRRCGSESETLKLTQEGKKEGFTSSSASTPVWSTVTSWEGLPDNHTSPPKPNTESEQGFLGWGWFCGLEIWITSETFFHGQNVLSAWQMNSKLFPILSWYFSFLYDKMPLQFFITITTNMALKNYKNPKATSEVSISYKIP